MRPIARLGVTVLVLWVALWAVARPATAHDEVVAVTPQPGAVIATPPDQATFTFAADVASGSAVAFVTPPGGPTVRLTWEELEVAGEVVTVPLTGVAPGVAPGSWRVALQTTGSDGHVAEFFLEFSVDAAVPARMPSGAPSPVTAGAQVDAAASGGMAGSAVAGVLAVGLGLVATGLVLRLRRG